MYRDEMNHVRLAAVRWEKADPMVSDPEVGHGSMLLNLVEAGGPRLWCFHHPISWD